MKKVISSALVALAWVSASAIAEPGAVHWSYEGDDGPEHWGDLSPEFVQCKVGLNQSPINIVSAVDADLPSLKIDYRTHTVELINNGHTAQANVAPGNFLRVGGESFQLIQFHLHTPSEHRIDGVSFPMETHYVHANEQGELAVVGVLHSEGPSSPDLVDFQSHIPEALNQPVAFKAALSDVPVTRLDTAYYRYNGSLTTPPCSEGVRWFVLKEPMPIAPEQQKEYQSLIGDDARGPQPVNARVVLE